MDTQQSINQSKVKIPVPTSAPSQPIPVSEDTDDIVLFDLGDNIQLSESQDSIYHYFVASPVFAGFGNLNSPERMIFLDTLSKASSPLKNYLTSSDTTELIFSLGKESGCNDSQISEIGILIRDLLTGKVFIKDFSLVVSSRLGIDDIKAGEITNNIISKSFGPIIEDVKRIQRSKFPDKIMQLQKEGRPEGLTRSEAPRLPQRPSEERGSTERTSANVQPPMMDIRPQPAPPQRPEFKIPDLVPKIEVKSQSNTGAQKSLEEELEKVANVIDLRSKLEDKP